MFQPLRSKSRLTFDGSRLATARDPSGVRDTRPSRRQPWARLALKIVKTGRLGVIGIMGSMGMVGAASCADTLTTQDDEATNENADEGTNATANPATVEELDQTETPLPDGIASESGNFVHRGRAGVIETAVDASSDAEWQSLDLDSGEQTEDEDSWDLAFSRFRVRINGGMSGPGSVEVATLMASFDDVDEPPEADAFSGEQPDSEGEDGDADADPDNAFNSDGDDWFLYNLKTHTLSPRKVSYVIKSTEDHYYKLRFLNYYDENGTPGRLTLRWSALSD